VLFDVARSGGGWCWLVWLSRIWDGEDEVDDVIEPTNRYEKDGNKSVDGLWTGGEQVLEVGVYGLGGLNGFQKCRQVDLYGVLFGIWGGD
jgi:hypothetical protein